MFSTQQVIEAGLATPSRRKLRAAVLVAAAAATLAGVYAYVAPASNATATRAPLDVPPGIAGYATMRPWSDNLSVDAVDSGGIERDLDGNASALVASDK